MDQERALKFMLNRLRRTPGSLGAYGYDVYIPSVIRTYLRDEEGQSWPDESRVRDLSPAFYAAAWELCRRGIIRPGVARMGLQATDDGSAGNGYSITPFGRTWLQEADLDAFVPTEPERFAQMIEPFRGLYGPGFHERAQEAIRCYGAHAYLACCAMCGAAAESILLAVATHKKDEESILKVYSSAGGRARVESIVLGQAKETTRREFAGFMTLLKYWRDESAHGKASQISDNEAYTSIALLLRFAMFVRDHWDELVRPTNE